MLYLAWLWAAQVAAGTWPNEKTAVNAVNRKAFHIPGSIPKKRGQSGTRANNVAPDSAGRASALLILTLRANYWYLSAMIGLIFTALLAGKQLARNATIPSTPATDANTKTSFGFTSNNRLAMNRVNPYAATNPATIPTSASSIDCPTIMLRSDPELAPRASRIPN